MWSLKRTLIVLSLLCAFVAEGQAETISLLPLKNLGISSKDAQRVNRWVESAGDRVEGVKWVIGAKVSRVANSPEFNGCESDKTCLMKLCGALDVDGVVFGHVGGLEGKYVLYLRLVTKSGAVENAVDGMLDPNHDLRRTTYALLLKLLRPKAFVGKLKLNVDVAGAWVYVDGARVAQTPFVPLDVDVGTHALRVTHPLYKDFVRFVDVRFEETTDLSIPLSHNPVESRTLEMKDLSGKPLLDHELPWYRRWWAVAAFGTVLLVAATVTVALVPKAVGRDDEVQLP